MTLPAEAGFAQSRILDCPRLRRGRSLKAPAVAVATALLARSLAGRCPLRALRSSRPVRLVVARCEVTSTGRLNAYLPEAVRLLVFKADGSVLVHADSGGYKPLNWMTHRPRRPQRPFSLRSWTTPRAFRLNRSGSIR